VIGESAVLAETVAANASVQLTVEFWQDASDNFWIEGVSA
jgi:hypothetical protein